MDEQELARWLRPGAWISPRDQKWLQSQYGHTASPQPAHPTQVATTAQNQARGHRFEHITIEGDERFIHHAHNALEKLKQTPSWSYAEHLDTIKQDNEPSPLISAYASGKTCAVTKNANIADPHWFAGTIVHEGAHVARGCAFGTEEERIAFGAEAEALRQMGSPHRHIADAEAHQRNPTHHHKWADECAARRLRGGK